MSRKFIHYIRLGNLTKVDASILVLTIGALFAPYAASMAKQRISSDAHPVTALPERMFFDASRGAVVAVRTHNTLTDSAPQHTFSNPPPRLRLDASQQGFSWDNTRATWEKVSIIEPASRTSWENVNYFIEPTSDAKDQHTWSVRDIDIKVSESSSVPTPKPYPEQEPIRNSSLELADTEQERTLLFFDSQSSEPAVVPAVVYESPAYPDISASAPEPPESRESIVFERPAYTQALAPEPVSSKIPSANSATANAGITLAYADITPAYADITPVYADITPAYTGTSAVSAGIVPFYPEADVSTVNAIAAQTSVSPVETRVETSAERFAAPAPPSPDASLTDLELAKMIYGEEGLNALDHLQKREAVQPLPSENTAFLSNSPLDAQGYPVLDADAPKIILVIGALGLNDAITDLAFKRLPKEVTFGFAPTREAVIDHAQRASREGRSFLREIPLEPINYPNVNPGELTLLTKNTDTENLQRLQEVFERIPGAVGISTYLGAQFVTKPESVDFLTRTLKEKGIALFEAYPTRRSLLQSTAQTYAVPYAQSHTTIDKNRDPAKIHEALARLEREAVSKGIAIGTGAAYHETIAAVQRWSKTLPERGIQLVPISEILFSAQTVN